MLLGVGLKEGGTKSLEKGTDHLTGAGFGLNDSCSRGKKLGNPACWGKRKPSRHIKKRHAATEKEILIGFDALPSSGGTSGGERIRQLGRGRMGEKRNLQGGSFRKKTFCS